MDEIDIKILKILQKNATIPLTELSKKVGVSTTPCWNRIKKMEEEKIINSKITILDNEKLNLSVTIFLSISISNSSDDWLNNFSKVINQYDEIIEVHRLTGTNTDYLLKIYSPSINEYDAFQQTLIKEIKCTEMSSSISLRTLKKSYELPLNYIKFKKTKQSTR